MDIKADQELKHAEAATNDASKDAAKVEGEVKKVEQAADDKAEAEAEAPRAVGSQPVEESVAKDPRHKNTGRLTHAQKISHDPAQPSSLTKPTQI